MRSKWYEAKKFRDVRSSRSSTIGKVQFALRLLAMLLLVATRSTNGMRRGMHGSAAEPHGVNGIHC